MVSSEKFMILDLNPINNEIDIFVNPSHPFYTRYVVSDISAYSAYRRVLAALALAWWSTKNRDPPASIDAYLKTVSNFLKGRAVLDD